jgi:hypothetical protein
VTVDLKSIGSNSVPTGPSWPVSLTAAKDTRDDANGVTSDTNQKVVKGVVGDPNYGDDSNLYEAMGYVRKSERASGLTKKSSTAQAAAKKTN